MRAKGFTIVKITEKLREEGINISSYLVWRTLKESEMEDIYREMLRILREHDVVMALMLLNVNIRERPDDGPDNGGEDKTNGKWVRILILSDVKKRAPIYCDIRDSFRLRDIIEVIDRCVVPRKADGSVFICLSQVPPLVPTRGSDNKLTRHLKNLGIGYKWISSRSGKRMHRKLSRKLSESICIADKGKVEECVRKVVMESFFKDEHWLYHCPKTGDGDGSDR